jgi:hypothetical protein
VPTPSAAKAALISSRQGSRDRCVLDSAATADTINDFVSGTDNLVIAQRRRHHDRW